MDQVVQSYAANHFMGSVLVARGDKVLFSKGYGFANLEWDIPNTPDTKFRIGSLTKQFTAVLILKLEEQGKLSVSDPVKKYIADAPAAWDKIKLFQLLTHTSGLEPPVDLAEGLLRHGVRDRFEVERAGTSRATSGPSDCRYEGASSRLSSRALASTRQGQNTQ
jgi:CubicO group peptidase (beta-lactamase class C family)